MPEYPPLPLDAELACRFCGNHAEAYFWRYCEDACPNCMKPWREQLHDWELEAWRGSGLEGVEVRRTSGNFLPSIYGPAGTSYVPR